MLVRLFVLLIAMAIVAAPTDAVRAETCSDAAAEVALDDDALFAQVVELTTAHRSPALAVPSRSDALRPMPALGRVFRPPRSSLA